MTIDDATCADVPPGCTGVVSPDLHGAREGQQPDPARVLRGSDPMTASECAYVVKVSAADLDTHQPDQRRTGWTVCGKPWCIVAVPGSHTTTPAPRARAAIFQQRP
jgi:hypothetical protein